MPQNFSHMSSSPMYFPGSWSPSKHPTAGIVVACIVSVVICLTVIGITAHIHHRRIRRKSAIVEPYLKAVMDVVEVPVNRVHPVHPRPAAQPFTGNSSLISGAPTSVNDASIRVVSASDPARSPQPAEATVLLQEILRRVQRLGDSELVEPPPGYC